MQEGLAGDLLAVGTAEDALGQLGTARTHQTGDTDDLAGAHGHVDILDGQAVRVQRVVYTPVAHFKNHLADLGIALRIAVGHFAAHHVLDDAVFADRFSAAVEGIDRGAVAQHGDRIGYLGNFVELVRDQDRGDALALQFQ